MKRKSREPIVTITLGLFVLYLFAILWLLEATNGNV